MFPYLLDLQSAAAAPPAFTLDVFASISIGAEVARVLHALAVPEYMDAWMQMPGADRVECHPDGKTFDRFRIDLYSKGTRQGMIHGACLLSKPNRITYLWDASRSSGRAHSVVEIRLLGAAGRCVLKLKHCGLETLEEHDWHLELWQRSLKRLCALVEGSAGSQVAVHAN